MSTGPSRLLRRRGPRRHGHDAEFIKRDQQRQTKADDDQQAAAAAAAAVARKSLATTNNDGGAAAAGATIWLSSRACARVTLARLQRLVLDPQWQRLLKDQDDSWQLRLLNSKFEQTIEIVDRAQDDAVVFMRTGYLGAAGDAVVHGFLDSGRHVAFSLFKTKEYVVSTLTMPLLSEGARIKIQERRIRPKSQRKQGQVVDAKGDDNDKVLASANEPMPAMVAEADSLLETDPDHVVLDMVEESDGASDIDSDSGSDDDVKTAPPQDQRERHPYRRFKVLDKLSTELKRRQRLQQQQSDTTDTCEAAAAADSLDRTLASTEYTLEIPWALFPPCCQARGLERAKAIVGTNFGMLIGRDEAMSKVTLPEFRTVHSARVEFSTNGDGQCDAETRACSVSWLNSYVPCDTECRTLFVQREAKQVMPEQKDWTCSHLARSPLTGLVHRLYVLDNDATTGVRVSFADVARECTNEQDIIDRLQRQHDEALTMVSAMDAVEQFNKGTPADDCKVPQSADDAGTTSAGKAMPKIESCDVCRDMTQWNLKDEQFALDATFRRRQRTQEFERIMAERHRQSRRIYKEHHEAFVALIRSQTQVCQTTQAADDAFRSCGDRSDKSEKSSDKLLDSRRRRPLQGYLACALPHDLSSCRFFRWASGLTGPEAFSRVTCLEASGSAGSGMVLMDHSVVRHPRTTMSTQLITTGTTSASSVRESADQGPRHPSSILEDESLYGGTLAGAIDYFGTFYDKQSVASFKHCRPEQWWGMADSCRIKVWDNETGVLVDHLSESCCSYFGERMDAIAYADDPWGMWNEHGTSTVQHEFANVDPAIEWDRSWTNDLGDRDRDRVRVCDGCPARIVAAGAHGCAAKSMADFHRGGTFGWLVDDPFGRRTVGAARSQDAIHASCSTLEEEILFHALSVAADHEDSLRRRTSASKDDADDEASEDARTQGPAQYTILGSGRARPALIARFKLSDAVCGMLGCSCRRSLQECIAKDQLAVCSECGHARVAHALDSSKPLESDAAAVLLQRSEMAVAVGVDSETAMIDATAAAAAVAAIAPAAAGAAATSENALDAAAAAAAMDRVMIADADPASASASASATDLLALEPHSFVFAAGESKVSAQQQAAPGFAKVTVLSNNKQMIFCSLVVDLHNALRRLCRARIEQYLIEDSHKTCMQELRRLRRNNDADDAVCPRVLARVLQTATKMFALDETCAAGRYEARFRELQDVLRQLEPFSHHGVSESEVRSQRLEAAMDLMQDIVERVFGPRFHHRHRQGHSRRRGESGAPTENKSEYLHVRSQQDKDQLQQTAAGNVLLDECVDVFCGNWLALHPVHGWSGDGPESLNGRSEIMGVCHDRLRRTSLQQAMDHEFSRWRWIRHPLSGRMVYCANLGTEYASEYAELFVRRHQEYADGDVPVRGLVAESRNDSVVDLFWHRYGAIVPFADERATDMNALYLFNVPIGQDMEMADRITFKVPSRYVQGLVATPTCTAKQMGRHWSEHPGVESLIRNIRCSMDNGTDLYCDSALLSACDDDNKPKYASVEQRMRLRNLFVDGRWTWCQGKVATHQDVAALLLAFPPRLLDSIMDHLEDWPQFTGTACNMSGGHLARWNSWSIVSYDLGATNSNNKKLARAARSAETKSAHDQVGGGARPSIVGWWLQSPCFIAESTALEQCRIQAYSAEEWRASRDTLKMLTNIFGRREGREARFPPADIDMVLRLYASPSGDPQQAQWIDCTRKSLVVYSLIKSDDVAGGGAAGFEPVMGIDWTETSARVCKWARSLSVWTPHWVRIEDKRPYTESDAMADQAELHRFNRFSRRFQTPLTFDFRDKYTSVADMSPYDPVTLPDGGTVHQRWNAYTDALDRTRDDHLRWCCSVIMEQALSDLAGLAFFAHDFQPDPAGDVVTLFRERCHRASFPFLFRTLTNLQDALRSALDEIREKSPEARAPHEAQAMPTLMSHLDHLHDLRSRIKTARIFDLADWQVVESSEPAEESAETTKTGGAPEAETKHGTPTASAAAGTVINNFGSVLQWWSHIDETQGPCQNDVWSFVQDQLVDLSRFNHCVDRLRAAQPQRAVASAGATGAAGAVGHDEHDEAGADEHAAPLGVTMDEKDVHLDRPFDPRLAHCRWTGDVVTKPDKRAEQHPLTRIKYDWSQFPGMYPIFDGLHGVCRVLATTAHDAWAMTPDGRLCDLYLVPQDQLLRLHARAVEQLVGFEQDKWAPLDDLVLEYVQHDGTAQPRDMGHVMRDALKNAILTRERTLSAQVRAGNEVYRIPWHSIAEEAASTKKADEAAAQTHVVRHASLAPTASTSTWTSADGDGDGQEPSMIVPVNVDHAAHEVVSAPCEYMMEIEHRVWSESMVGPGSDRVQNVMAGTHDRSGDLLPLTQLPGGFVDQFRHWWKRRKDKAAAKKEDAKSLAASKLHSKVDKSAAEAAIINARAEENKVELKVKIGQRKQIVHETGFKFTWSHEHQETVITELQIPDSAKIGGGMMSGGGAWERKSKFPGKRHASACETVAHHPFYHKDFAQSSFVAREIRRLVKNGQPPPPMSTTNHFFFLTKLQGRTCSLCLKEQTAHSMRVLMPCQHKFCALCLQDSDKRLGKHVCPECSKSDPQYRYQEAVMAPILFDQGTIPEIKNTRSLISSAGESVVYRVGQTQSIEDLGQQWNPSSEGRECVTNAPGFYYHRSLQQLLVWREFSPDCIQAAWNEQLNQLAQVRYEFPRLFDGVSEAQQRAVAAELKFFSFVDGGGGPESKSHDVVVAKPSFGPGDGKRSATQDIGLGLGGHGSDKQSTTTTMPVSVVFHGESSGGGYVGFGAGGVAVGSGHNVYAQLSRDSTSSVSLPAATSAVGSRSTSSSRQEAEFSNLLDQVHAAAAATAASTSRGDAKGDFKASLGGAGAGGGEASAAAAAVADMLDELTAIGFEQVHFHSDQAAPPGGPSISHELDSVPLDVWPDFSALPGSADAADAATRAEQADLLKLFSSSKVTTTGDSKYLAVGVAADASASARAAGSAGAAAAPKQDDDAPYELHLDGDDDDDDNVGNKGV